MTRVCFSEMLGSVREKRKDPPASTPSRRARPDPAAFQGDLEVQEEAAGGPVQSLGRHAKRRAHDGGVLGSFKRPSSQLRMGILRLTKSKNPLPGPQRRWFGPTSQPSEKAKSKDKENKFGHEVFIFAGP